MTPLIIDSFAGGGGASTGIEMALGRSPDIAINHSADALAMHEVNHPGSLHLSKNIWQVDPLEVVGNRPVGLAWFSPDCKHFSKAKGGRPVKRNIRDLAWTVVLWAKRVRPAVIILENVEEFQTWGPLIEKTYTFYPKDEDGTVTGEGIEKTHFVPDPERKGETFRQWLRELKRLGYKVEFRELRACDYGTPTIRKRFFMIARRDGQPIVWPEPTHGKPGDPDVIAGRKLPWRTAAEIIDWSLPCPSIFDTAEEIKARHGVRAIRPLADATMRRIARGIVRYVLEAKRPFIVSVAHGDSGGRREYSIDEPAGTQTSAGNAHAVVAPVVTFAQHGGANRSAEAPLHTITASPKDQNAVIAAHLTKFNRGATGSALDEPTPTITANSYVQRPGCAAPIGVVAAHITRQFGEGTGYGLDQPARTDTASVNKSGVVAAFLAQHNNDSRRIGGVNPGRPANEPLATLTASGAQQQVVAAHLSQFYGSNDGSGGDLRCPHPTVTTSGDKGGGHSGLISAFLTKYYGTGDGARVTEPMHTDTTKDRMGLVTLEIDGATYAIADIGMRMLTPRERFRAQGFPDDYIIDRRPDGTPLTAKVQGSCCGNSVCPPLAQALVAANCAYLSLRPIMEAAE